VLVLLWRQHHAARSWEPTKTTMHDLLVGVHGTQRLSPLRAVPAAVVCWGQLLVACAWWPQQGWVKGQWQEAGYGRLAIGLGCCWWWRSWASSGLLLWLGIRHACRLSPGVRGARAEKGVEGRGGARAGPWWLWGAGQSMCAWWHACCCYWRTQARVGFRSADFERDPQTPRQA
jgi:hypothetical protein